MYAHQLWVKGNFKSCKNKITVVAAVAAVAALAACKNNSSATAEGGAGHTYFTLT